MKIFTLPISNGYSNSMVIYQMYFENINYLLMKIFISPISNGYFNSTVIYQIYFENLTMN